MNILLVEDDLQLGKALCRGLEIAGFQPCWVKIAYGCTCSIKPKSL